jgi:hypothetical protein
MPPDMLFDVEIVVRVPAQALREAAALLGAQNAAAILPEVQGAVMRTVYSMAFTVGSGYHLAAAIEANRFGLWNALGWQAKMLAQPDRKG